jgi:CPA1 family monovalent cation:H+ antiporter
MLALFVAPVLLDAAFDTSLRDLKQNWIPVTCLVLAAVGVTTAAVAWVVHELVPGMPWSAAIALGAIVAPPDAAAASAILKQLRLPHRLVVILEGESLLNDASALLVYRLAVLAAVSSGFDLSRVIPLSILSIGASAIVGYVTARLYMRATLGVEDVSSSIVLQFAGTFGVWILAERTGLSPIVTMVVYAMTVARDAPALIPARRRIPSYAVWGTVVFVLNVLAFVLIGLQLRPVLAGLSGVERSEFLQVAAIVLGVVVLARFAWVFVYYGAVRLALRYFGDDCWPAKARPTIKSALVVGWCGMRGIVTLAAAFALPLGFPFRDLILLCAFCVVVGTLVVQGLTLRPLILALQLKDEGPVDHEVQTSFERMTRVGLEVLDADPSPQARVLRQELQSRLDDGAVTNHFGNGPSPYEALRARVVEAQRRTLLEMRAKGEIGDDAFHLVEAHLDVAEVGTQGALD